MLALVRTLGFIFGIFIIFFISAAVIYFGWNYLAEAYNMPTIKSFWHAVVGLMIVNLITSRFKRSRSE